MNRGQIAIIVSIVSTVSFVIAAALMEKNVAVSDVFTIIWIVTMIVSLVLCGFMTALRMCKSIAFWGWVAVPFPMDIVTGLITFFVALFLLFCFPVVPVVKAYRENY